MADSKISQLGAKVLERVLIQLCPGVPVSQHTHEDLHRTTGAEQLREGRHAATRHMIGTLQGDNGRYQQQLFSGEALPAEVLEPGVVNRLVVDIGDLQIGNTHGAKEFGQLAGRLIKIAGGRGAWLCILNRLKAIGLIKPALLEGAIMNETDDILFLPVGLQHGNRPLDTGAALI